MNASELKLVDNDKRKAQKAARNKQTQINQ